MDKIELCTKAQELRKKLGEDISSPIDIFSLAYSIERLTLVFYPMSNNLSGVCIKDKDNPVIVINSQMSLGRQKFSLAHELYHLFFDDNEQYSICPMKIGTGSTIEKCADQFASYFLIPPIGLSEFLNRISQGEKNVIALKEIVMLEQYFGVSRQAILYRLVEDNKLSLFEAEKYKKDVIRSALNLGYDVDLYKPLPPEKQYKTFGHYIKQAERLLDKELISNGKYEELLLSAFRSDLVYGIDITEGELND